MKTITVSNGDIKLSTGKIQFSTGNAKLVQDISLWLKEPIGTGFTTPNFGSLLPQLVGGTQSASTISTVTNEIIRVLQLYQGQQALYLQQAQNTAQLANWNKSEIIQNIVSVNVSIQNTTIFAAIALNTLNNNTVNLNLTINSNGVNITNGWYLRSSR